MAVEPPAEVMQPRLAPPSRVLVVDDETAIVGVESEILRVAGFTVTGVRHPREALAQAAEDFDAVVTDFRMPELDGLSLFQQLRRRNPRLVGVLVTGFGSVKLVQTAMRAGFAAILLKPFPLDRLTTALQRALRQQRLTEENQRLAAILDAHTNGQDLNRPRTRGALALLLAQKSREMVEAAETAVLVVDPVSKILRRPYVDESAPWPEWAEELVGQPGEAGEPVLRGDHQGGVRLTVPLAFGDWPEGLLAVTREPAFDPLEFERLTLLGRQGALALSYLRLFEERMRDEKLALVGRVAGAICQRIQRPVEIIQAVGSQLEVDEPDYRDMIVENAVRLEDMCGEMSDFVAGDQHLYLQPVSLRWLLDSAVRYQLPTLTALGVKVKLETPDDAVMRLDERKLLRALQNLVKNAGESMPDGGQLTLALHLAADQVSIEVTDTGCGMTEEVQARVFEPFFSHAKAGGTGLGGAVVRSAAAAHGGTVDVHSVVGEGTTFRVNLPRR